MAVINISRDEKKVKVAIDTGLNQEVWLYWNAENELFAKLLTIKLNEQLSREIKRIREEEYNAGWSDKTKRRPKKTWFKSYF